MPRLCRRVPKIVVTPIDIADWTGDQFLRTRVIESSHLDQYAGTDHAHFRNVRAHESSDAAVLAKDVMRTTSVELVVAQHPFTCDQPKCVRFDGGAPVAHLGADGAVALDRTSGEIESGLVTHCAAVT